VDALQFGAYVEGTESPWQAPYLGRQSLDQLRHRQGFTWRKWRFYALRKYYKVRNPDRWLPDEKEVPGEPASRRFAVIGLLVILFLLVGGFALTHILGGMTRLQDCALSGRSNCGVSTEGRAP
jgi:hypothetical protein